MNQVWPSRIRSVCRGLACWTALTATLCAIDTLPERPARLEGTGRHSRLVTPQADEAQAYFDQGLRLLYAFNHDEALRAFRYAASLEPKQAMHWWGIALANGPHINNPVVPADRAREAWQAIERAHATLRADQPLERRLIEALRTRYSADENAERPPLDEAYARAMRDVWRSAPTDVDVGALFAEALMDLRPWDLWTPEGTPQPGTDEIVATLEAVLTQDPHHPLALHLYIHAVEASPHPDRALAPANRLRDLMPGVGHMVHMPSHIDVRLGHWEEAIEANARAIVADTTYRTQVPQQGFYRIYMAHNEHMRAYAAMMSGRRQLALDSIDAMLAAIPPAWVAENIPLADMLFMLPWEVRVRFGMWDEILSSPEPLPDMPITRSTWHAARGIALAAQGQMAEARQEQSRFEESRKQVPPEAVVGNNRASDILDVASHLLAGEIDLRDGQTDRGLDWLRSAVEREDRLRYSEPPDWMHPVRHALGAHLIAADRVEEAGEVYLASLARVPRDGWALYGLIHSLQLEDRQDKAEGWRRQFDEVWRHADVEITSSCFCQPNR